MDEILSGMINKQAQYLIGEVSQIHSSEGLMFLKLKYNATSYTIFNTPPITKGADKNDSDCNV